MAITRIKNNQITDTTINAAAKLVDYSVTAGKLANSLVYGSDLTVSGNLTVNGQTTTIDTISTVIEDPILLLAKDQATPSADIGYIGERGTSDNIAFVWDESADQFVTAFTTDTTTNTNITITSYADLKVNNFETVGNITIGGNISSLNVTGNITGGNVISTGVVAATGNVSGGNLTTAGAVAAQTVSATGNVSGGNLTTAGDVTTATVTATGNVSGGNLTTGGVVSATGNVSGGNLTTAGAVSSQTVSATGNVSGGNLTTGGVVSATGNVTGGNLTTAGVVEATGNVIGGNITTVGQVTATGNITGNYFFGNGSQLTGIDATQIQNGTSNVRIPTSGGNVEISIAGTDDVVVVNSAGGDVTGYWTATGNVSGGNLITGGLVNATGNVSGGNITTAGVVTATGNVSGGNLTTAGAVSAQTVSATGNVSGGNLTTAGVVSATGNVSGGNLTTAGAVAATGNVSGGNITTAGQVNATGNVTGGNVVTGTVTTSSGDLVLNSAGGALQWDGTGNIVMNSQWINNLAEPVAAYDAATKQYVDDAVSSGITIHAPVDVETPTALPAATYAQGGSTYTVTDTIAGNTVVFSSAANLQVNDQLWFSSAFSGIVANAAYFVVSTPNTSAAVLSMAYDGTPVSNISNATGLTQSVRVNSGVGATLTANVNGALTVDSFSVSVGNRVLVYNQSTAYENGVYDVTQVGNVSAPWILTRSSNEDVYGPKSTTELDVGDYFYVKYGATGAGESYVMTAPEGPFVIGYDGLTFTQFSASQVYTANTAAGLSLTGTVFAAKIDNNTTAFDGSGNIIVKAGANLTTPNIGAATGTSLSVTGNVSGGNLVSTGDVTTSTVTASSTVTATGNVSGGNITTGGVVEATGNVSGGNLTTAGAVAATGNVSGGNLTTAGVVSATGNVSGGNITTVGVVSATGNVSGGNLTTTGAVAANTATLTGNLSGTGATFTGNVTAANFIGNIVGNITGNVDAGGSNTQVQFNDDNLLNGTAGFTFDKTSNLVTVTGNISGGNLTTAGDVTTATVTASSTVSATGNVSGGNITTGGVVSATGNVSGGNITTGGLVNATGNVTGGNITTGGIVNATGNVTGGNITTGGVVAATGNVSGGNIVTTGTADLGNIRISGDNITNWASNKITVNSAGSDIDLIVSGDTIANLLVVDAGTDTVLIGTGTATTNVALKIGTTNSMMVPVGNTAQRPATPVSGMVRYNSQTGYLEYYDADSWTTASAEFTVIDSQTFNGDGSTVAFTLNTAQTTNSCIVSINGVVQVPGTAYSVSTTTLTFTEAPLSGDVIEVREITTTSTVASLSNASGNASIECLDNAATVQVEGDLLPSANVTYNLGSNAAQWNDLYLSGNTIYLGGLQLQASGNTFVVYTADGVTQANIDAGSIDVSAISSGTSTIGISGANGNTFMTVGGTANVLVASTTGVAVAGTLNATGNITGGNLSGTSIVGTLTTAAQTNITSVGTLSTLGVTGNISGGNVSGTTGAFTNVGGTLTTNAQPNITSVGTLGSLSVTGNVTAGNLSVSTGAVTLGSIVNANANGVGNIGSATGYFNTVFAKATSAQYADLAEMYEADGVIEPGTVVEFGGTKEVTVCGEEGSRRVAGVVSTNPSYIMNAGLQGDNVVAVALTGRVPVKVTGQVRKGDMMIAAGNGRARAEANPAVGSVIGKALADFDGIEGTIEVVVGRI